MLLQTFFFVSTHGADAVVHARVSNPVPIRWIVHCGFIINVLHVNGVAFLVADRTDHLKSTGRIAGKNRSNTAMIAIAPAMNFTMKLMGCGTCMASMP